MGNTASGSMLQVRKYYLPRTAPDDGSKLKLSNFRLVNCVSNPVLGPVTVKFG